MKIRMLRPALVYRTGDILPSVPLGQAREWIRLRLAEEVKEDPSAPVAIPPAADPAAPAVIESATANPYDPLARRKAAVPQPNRRRD